MDKKEMSIWMSKEQSDTINKTTAFDIWIFCQMNKEAKC